MSTTEVKILGDGAFAGAAANVSSYSVQEYGTPLSLTDLGAGVPSISFSVLEDTGFDGSVLLPGQRFELSDPYSGSQHGIIDGGSSNNGYELQVSASGALLPLVSSRSVPAFSGTLGSALISYFAVCGITSGFQLDPDISAKPVDLPAWEGDVWTQLKKLMAIHQFEIADVAGTIIIRKLRLRNVDIRKYTSLNLDYGRAQASQIVEVYYYNNEWKVDTQVYPPLDSLSPDRSIISVQASEVSTTNYSVDMWVESIDAPEHVLVLEPDVVTSTSVYSVVDKDGVPVSVADWKNGGGDVWFEIGEDGRSIDVSVRGMSTQGRSPYRIASSSADREYQYSALWIAATGMAFRREMVWSATGADLVDAPSDSITTIDDPIVSTRQDAVEVLAAAVRAESGFSQRLEVGASAINRRGETGQQLYPTFGQFDEDYAGWTFGQFDAEYSGWTFEEFTDFRGEEYASDFQSQAMGGIGGARVRHRDNIYRIREGSTSPSGFSWAAEPDLLFGEWDELSGDAPLTFGEFDEKWAGKTFEQHARMPLYNAPISPPTPPVDFWYGFGPYGLTPYGP